MKTPCKSDLFLFSIGQDIKNKDQEGGKIIKTSKTSNIKNIISFTRKKLEPETSTICMAQRRSRASLHLRYEAKALQASRQKLKLKALWKKIEKIQRQKFYNFVLNDFQFEENTTSKKYDYVKNIQKHLSNGSKAKKNAAITPVELSIVAMKNLSYNFSFSAFNTFTALFPEGGGGGVKKLIFLSTTQNWSVIKSIKYKPRPLRPKKAFGQNKIKIRASKHTNYSKSKPLVATRKIVYRCDY